MTKTHLAGKRFSFEANLEAWAEGMDYCAISVPAEITEALGTKGPVLVKAQVNDSTPFQVSLFPVGGGRHYIRIKASVRKATKTGVGDAIRLNFEVIDPEDVEIPDDLLAVLENDDLMDGFMALPPGKRNYIIRRIQEAAKPETREKRIQEGASEAVARLSKNTRR